MSFNADIMLHLDRLTFNATLAEITSLEELLSTIMAEDDVHEDVINKLWQVYSETTFSSGSCCDSAQPFF